MSFTKWVRVRNGLYRVHAGTSLGIIARMDHQPADKRWRVTWKGMMGDHVREVATLANAKAVAARGH